MSGPLQLSQSPRDAAGGSVNELLKAYNKSTSRYLSSDQQLNLDGRVIQIHMVTDKKIFIRLSAFSRIEGGQSPRNDGLWYKYDIYINGSTTRSSTYSVTSEVGVGGGNERLNDRILATIEHTERITSLGIRLMLRGDPSWNYDGSVGFHIDFRPIYLNLTTNIIFNRNNTQLNMITRDDLYKDYESITVQNNRVIYLSNETIPENTIVYIKATYLFTRVYTGTKTVDHGRYSYSNEINTGNNTINGFILMPYASIGLMFNSTMDTWLIMSYCQP